MPTQDQVSVFEKERITLVISWVQEAATSVTTETSTADHILESVIMLS